MIPRNWSGIHKCSKNSAKREESNRGMFAIQAKGDHLDVPQFFMYPHSKSKQLEGLETGRTIIILYFLVSQLEILHDSEEMKRRASVREVSEWLCLDRILLQKKKGVVSYISFIIYGYLADVDGSGSFQLVGKFRFSFASTFNSHGEEFVIRSSKKFESRNENTFSRVSQRVLFVRTILVQRDNMVYEV